MKLQFSVIGLVLLHCFVTYVCSADRNFLFNEFNAKNGLKALININEWRNKMMQRVHNDLQEIPAALKAALIAEADKENESVWPSLLVSQFLEFVENGNRNRYEGSDFNRRNRLEKLVIGELLTNSGKYMNQIINGLWLTLEESTWVLPAHLYLQKAGSGLPDPEEPVIDLFNAEAANHIAFIRLALGDKLNKINKMFDKRIDYELNRRIVEPYLSHNFSWITMTNNWNPWINTNVLKAVLFTTNDEKKRNDIMVKAIKSVDHFLNNYPDDGGCDEGPGYWNVAGGKLIEFIDLLSSISNGSMNWSTNQLIHDMGSYTYKLYIGNGRFVNFADAPADAGVDTSKVMKFGVTFQDEKLKQFAAHLDQYYGNKSSDHLSRALGLTAFGGVEDISSIKSTPPIPTLVAEAWLPNLQVLSLRSKEGSTDGLFLGAKGGTNGESHNHNDVGSFVLYINAKPGLIDIGPQAYNKDTFGPNRYKIWNLQSQWHNCPSINGFDQHEGGEYRAHNVSYTKTANGGDFEADIAGAYLKEAAVKSWKRKFIYNNSPNTLTLEESYELSEWKKPFVIHFITILSESGIKNGELVLKKDDVELIMQYDQNVFDVNVEKHVIEDVNLLHSWGDHINRVNLVAKDQSLKGTFSTVFKMP